MTQRQLRALEDIQEFETEIDYYPGARNVIQDALSRRPDYKDPPFKLPGLGGRPPRTLDAELCELIVENAKDWLQQIKDGYHDDPYFADVLAYFEGKQSAAADVTADPLALADSRRRIQARGRHYNLEANGTLTYSASGTLCIPNVRSLRQTILHEAHDMVLGGHFGNRRTHSAIARRFFWPRQFQEVKNYVRGCATCARTKSTNQKPSGLLQPLEIPEERWRRINIDFITKLPTVDGYDTIITFIDALTKRAHWVVTTEKGLTAEKFAEIFTESFIRLHGLPDVIVSDRDVRFTGDFWQHLMGVMGTKLSMSTAFHPQTDGQAEKANSIVERFLRAYTSDEQRDWAKLLPLAEFAYNASRQQSIEMSPFEADIGHIPRMPLDAIVATSRRSPRGHPPTNNRRAQLRNLHG